ncbi:SDR family oxidoreductase, partial [bacterium]|nr:SDR family oxidoreductase [bacterium]
LAGGHGRIVNVASTAGLEGGPYIAAYAASKHAVVGFTRSVAAETEGTGVTVNAVCPGYVDTDLTRESVERIVAKTGRDEAAAREMLASANASGRLLSPDEVADVVAGLCADEAGSIHGQIIIVDGSEE